jgi:hypothetical protein
VEWAGRTCSPFRGNIYHCLLASAVLSDDAEVSFLQATLASTLLSNTRSQSFKCLVTLLSMSSVASTTT